MWLSWSKWWWEQDLHLADLCRRGSWRLRRESFRPLPWGVASIDKNCRQFQNFWIGPDGSALGSLESASEFDWRWRWGTLTCRNHCCMSMGFRSLIKIISVLILLNWNFKRNSYPLHIRFQMNSFETALMSQYILNAHTMALTVHALGRECADIGAPEVAPGATLYLSYSVTKIFQFWCKFSEVIRTTLIHNFYFGKKLVRTFYTPEFTGLPIM